MWHPVHKICKIIHRFSTLTHTDETLGVQRTFTRRLPQVKEEDLVRLVQRIINNLNLNLLVRLLRQEFEHALSMSVVLCFSLPCLRARPHHTSGDAQNTKRSHHLFHNCCWSRLSHLRKDAEASAPRYVSVSVSVSCQIANVRCKVFVSSSTMRLSSAQQSVADTIVTSPTS